MSDLRPYTLLVHEALSDGRFVVTNASTADVPVGAIFIDLVAEHGTVDRDGVYQVVLRDGATRVALKVATVEFFRRAVDCIPKGHHAAIAFEGSGFGDLQAILECHKKPWQVMLRSAREQSTDLGG